MIKEFKNFHSTIFSRVKRQSKWIVKAGETLKAKQHMVVTTKQDFKDGWNEEMKYFRPTMFLLKKTKKNLSQKSLKKLLHLLRKEIKV